MKKSFCSTARSNNDKVFILDQTRPYRKKKTTNKQTNKNKKQTNKQTNKHPKTKQNKTTTKNKQTNKQSKNE